MSVAALEATTSYLYESPNPTGSPERLLLLAVLERAILDFVGNDTREAEAASSWLFDDDDAESPTNAPFSFAWVCRELDLNPAGVSEMVRAMPKRGKHRIAPWYFARKAH